MLFAAASHDTDAVSPYAHAGRTRMQSDEGRETLPFRDIVSAGVQEGYPC